MKVIKVVLMIYCSLLVGCSLNNPGQFFSKDTNLTAANYNVQLGLGYLQQNDTAAAKSKLMLAVSQAPNWPVALDGLAYYYEVIGENVKADELYRKALRKGPKSGLALNNYGTFLCRTKRNKEAEHYLLAAANDDDYINTAEAFENAGLCELGIPDNAKAEMYFKRALMQDPNRITSMYELSKLYFSKGNYVLAAEYINKFNNKTNSDPKALWLAIQIAKKLGDFNTIGKDGNILQQRFPNSNEYQLYQKMQS